MAFDTSKNFSLRWVDPPIGLVSRPNSNHNPTSNQNESNFSIPEDQRLDEIGSRNHQNGSTSNNGDEEMIKPGSVIDKDSLGPGIEILKFEDRSGWWFCGNTKGRLILQENAIKTLGLDRTFWIAVSRVSSFTFSSAIYEERLEFRFETDPLSYLDPFDYRFLLLGCFSLPRIFGGERCE